MEWNGSLYEGRYGSELSLYCIKTVQNSNGWEQRRYKLNICTITSSLILCVSFGSILIFPSTFFLNLNWHSEMLSKSQLLQKTGQCIVKKDTKQKTSSESWDHSGGMQTQFSNSTVSQGLGQYPQFLVRYCPLLAMWKHCFTEMDFHNIPL